MRSAILWCSGEGEQIDIKVDESGIVLTVRGGAQSLETCSLHSTDVMAVKALEGIAARVGLLEDSHVN